MSLPSSVLAGWDATGVNVASVPAGLGVPFLYLTGEDGVPATYGQALTYPEAIWCDQSPTVDGVDTTADVYDVETGAITIEQCPAIYKEALANYQQAVRPGQRYPAFYVDQANLTPLCNEFVAAGIASGPRLHVAYLGIAQADAVAQLEASGGPFPLVGIQTANKGTYDTDLFLASWVYATSARPAAAQSTLVSVSSAGALLANGSTIGW